MDSTSELVFLSNVKQWVICKNITIRFGGIFGRTVKDERVENDTKDNGGT